MNAPRQYAYACTKAITHGPPDGQGRCPWCGKRCANTAQRPAVARWEPSDLTEAYEYAYDPDYGTRDPDEIRHRYQTGQNG